MRTGEDLTDIYYDHTNLNDYLNPILAPPVVPVDQILLPTHTLLRYSDCLGSGV